MLGKQKIICGRLSISQIRLFFCSYYANLKKQAIGACTRLLLNCGTGSFCWKNKIRLYALVDVWKQPIVVETKDHVWCAFNITNPLAFLFILRKYKKNSLKEPVLDCCFIVFFLAFGKFLFPPQNSRFFFPDPSMILIVVLILVLESQFLCLGEILFIICCFFFPSKIRPRLNNIFFRIMEWI